MNKFDRIRAIRQEHRDDEAPIKLPVKKKLVLASVTQLNTFKEKRLIPSKAASKYITLSEAQADKKSSTLYVLNNTGSLDPGGKRSDIIIDVAMAKGDNSMVLVKDTWMPINVAVQAPRRHILYDRLFMRAIEYGQIKIVTNEWAEKELAKPDIADEQQRIHLRDTQEIINVIDNVDGPQMNTGVSMQVAEIFTRNIGSRERLATLKNIANTLTDSDLHFIMTRCVSEQEQKLKQFCEKLRLSKRR